MKLNELLEAASKAQLQSYFLHWFPGREVLSSRDRLTVELRQAMDEHASVRDRFDALSKSQQGFLVGLLVRDGFRGTVDEMITSVMSASMP